MHTTTSLPGKPFFNKGIEDILVKSALSYLYVCESLLKKKPSEVMEPRNVLEKRLETMRDIIASLTSEIDSQVSEIKQLNQEKKTLEENQDVLRKHLTTQLVNKTEAPHKTVFDKRSKINSNMLIEVADSSLQTESDCNSTVSKIENILDDRLNKIEENIKETAARTFAAEKQLNHTQRVNEAVTDIMKHGTKFDEKLDKIEEVFTKIVETKLQENAAMVETKLNILMKNTKTRLRIWKTPDHRVKKQLHLS